MVDLWACNQHPSPACHAHLHRRRSVVQTAAAARAAASWWWWFLLMVCFRLASSHDGAPFAAPHWLLGLQDLQNQQQELRAGLTASSDTAGASSAGTPQLLLRPRKLPAQLASSSATLQAISSRPIALASVAHNYGTSTQQLRHMMLHDVHLRATPQGLLVWVCGGSSGPPSSSNSSNDSTATMATPGSIPASSAWLRAHSNSDIEAIVGTAAHAPLLPPRPPEACSTAAWPQPQLHDAFALHSRPRSAAKHTIFLDFRGCTIRDSYWNTATGKPLLQTAPFDLDGDPGSLTDAERRAVIDIWLAVAQDYAAWDVDITTERPPQDALIRRTEGDDAFGMRVCVGGSSADTIGGLAGGLAFTGAWGQLGHALQPVLVFPKQLGNGHARAVADSISHEVGHTIGLQHFGGADGAAYDEGAGPWGPLLGLPYGRTLSRWGRGAAVSGALQDDLHAISSQLAALADDHGDTPAAATQLLCSSDGGGGSGGGKACGGSHAGQVSVRGTIGQADDVDVFSIVTISSRPAALALQPAGQVVRVQLLLPASSTPGVAVNNLLASLSITNEMHEVPLATAQHEHGGETHLEAHALVDVESPVYIRVAQATIQGVPRYGSLGDYELRVSLETLTSSSSSSSRPQQQATRHSLPAHATAGRVTSRHSSNGGSTPGVQVIAARNVLAFAAPTCSSTAPGGLVLLAIAVTSGNSVAEDGCSSGGILAAAPAHELLLSCQACTASGAVLPVALLSQGFVQEGNFACQQGGRLYSYAWRAPREPGCYRLTARPRGSGSGSGAATTIVVIAGGGTIPTAAGVREGLF